MDLLTRIELEVRARMTADTTRIVTEELRRHLPSMTLGDLHAFLSSELGRRAFHVPIADILATPATTSEEAPPASAQGMEDSPDERLTWKEATLRFQASFFRKTIAACDWSIARTARRLDVARSAVYTMIDRFGVDYHRTRMGFPPHDPEEPNPQD